MFNTIATIPGSEKPNEYVMLSAHFDSWDGASGATDNGTGTVMMMEAMRILKQVYPNPKRTILRRPLERRGAGLIGSRAYREDHPEVVEGLQALFNQDNGTGRIAALRRARASPMPPRRLARLAREAPRRRCAHGITFSGVGAPGLGGSDDASFYCARHRPPSGSARVRWNYSNYTWHTNCDTYDKVVFDDVRSTRRSSRC